MEKRTNFYVSYLADETLPLNKSHKGFKASSTRKRSRFFSNTEKGRKKGLEFFNECKYPLTKKKNLLFLYNKEEGIKQMEILKITNKKIELQTDMVNFNQFDEKIHSL